MRSKKSSLEVSKHYKKYNDILKFDISRIQYICFRHIFLKSEELIYYIFLSFEMRSDDKELTYLLIFYLQVEQNPAVKYRNTKGKYKACN